MSNFQRRHYEAIADVLRQFIPDIREEEATFYILTKQWLKIYDGLANKFLQDNPNFDNIHFAVACGWYGDMKNVYFRLEGKYNP